MKCRGSKRGLHEHATVAEVRECYGQPQTTPPIQYPRTYSDKAEDSLPKIHVPQSAIDELKKMPGDDIPEGYYATPSLTGNNDLDFWHIEKGTGRWKGYTFVKRVIGGRDDASVPRDSKKKVKTERINNKVTQFAVMQAIRDFGIKKSKELFGTELKYCRECGVHLTNERSRLLGIGPDCENK